LNPRTLLTLGMVAALAAPAAGQRAREEESLSGAREELEGRSRELLHRGVPLDLVGVGAGDADALARTPALARASFGATSIEREALAARKLALYEGGARFDAAPRPALAAPAPIAPQRARQLAQGPPASDALAAAPSAAFGPWAVLLGLCAVGSALLGAAWALRRRRPSAARGRA